MSINYCVKQHYKSALQLRRITAINCGLQEIDFNLLDALFLLETAWQQTILVSTIKNGFRKAGFVTNITPDVEVIPSYE